MLSKLVSNKLVWGSILLTLAVGLLTAAEHHGIVKYGTLAVPGASVTVTAQKGDTKLTALTNAQGEYYFADLAEGVWNIQVDMQGFSPLKREVTIPAGEATSLELTMLPLTTLTGATTVPVEVKVVAAPKPEIAATKPKPNDAKQTATNTASGFQRTNVTAAAGANATAQQPTPPAAPDSADTAQRAADGFLVNGSVNNGASTQFSQAAAFGNNRGARRWPYGGNLSFNLDKSAFDARPFSITGQDTVRPPFTKFQGTASISGPIRIPGLVKNGPTFQLSYQWGRNRNASIQSSLMPTERERGGDFSQTLSLAGKPVQVLDPTTGLPFLNNQVPLTSISPQALSLLKYYPLPQPNFNGQSRYNFQVPIVSGSHTDGLQFSTNRTIKRKNNVQGQFAYNSSRSDNPNVFGFLDTGRTRSLNGSASVRHQFSNRFNLRFGVSFQHSASRNIPFFSNRTNVSGAAGITGNNQVPVNWGPPALTFSSGIASLSDVQYSNNRNQSIAYNFDGLYSRGGRHTFSYGADLRRVQVNQFSQQDPRGSFNFTGATTGSDFAGFLLGIPDTASIAFGNADKYLRSNNWDAYVTDDWRFRSGLTLQLGMRWEYGSPVIEKYGRLVNLAVDQGFRTAIPIIASNVDGPLLKPDKNNFAPRISLAWRPFAASSMVVKASYDVGYDTNVYQGIVGQMTQQSPLSTSLRVQNTVANPLTLANGFRGSAAVTATTFGVDPNLVIGYAQNWMVSVQRDLPAALIMVATYQGIKGTHGLQQILPNTFPSGGTNPCPSCAVGFNYLTSNGNSTREAGALNLRRRLRKGFQAELTYTYAKAIDNSGLGGSGSLTAQNWQDFRAERARSNFDQRHALTVGTQYTTGATSGLGFLTTGRTGTFFKEWTVVTQLNIGTGRPLTPSYNAPVNGTGAVGSLRANYTGADVYAAPPGLFLNPLAYTAPTAGQWGNAGRNSITGPSTFSFDGSISRTVRVNDRLSADIRVQASNLLNHPVFPSWSTSINSSQFGLPGGAGGMRNITTSVRMRF
ncbi:MAG: TonB-dependent receptor [Acidobacteriota bacterium]